MTAVWYSFEWSFDATNVVVTGTFDSWSQSIPLTRKDSAFKGSVELNTEDKILFKFVVDGKWVTSPDYKTEADESGIINNVLYADDLQKLVSQKSVREDNNVTEDGDDTIEGIKSTTGERYNSEEIENEKVYNETEKSTDGNTDEKVAEKFEGVSGTAPESAETLQPSSLGQRKSINLLVEDDSGESEHFEAVLASQKSNTQSSTFTDIEHPKDVSHVAGNGMPAISFENNSTQEGTNLAEVQLELSFKSLSSNEIYSSTHGTLSHFNMENSAEIENNTRDSGKRAVLPLKERSGLVGRLKRFFR